MKSMLMRPKLIPPTVKGIKTHTRRCGQLKEINEAPSDWKLWAGQDSAKRFITFYKDDFYPLLFITPRYQTGDIVYIKEAWQISNYQYKKYAVIRYKSDNVFITVDWDEWLEKNTKYGGGADDAEKWRSPLHLPAKFARHFVKILGHEAKRLRDMTEENAIQEGIPFHDGKYWFQSYPFFHALPAYMQLWDSINPLYPFKLNPWVIDYPYEYLKDYRI